jgi:hypothetical protein
MPLELTDEETTVLSEVLESVIGDLRVEVRRTETRSYHDDLKRRETLLEGLLEKLRGA